LSSKGGKISCTLPYPPVERLNVEVEMIFAPKMLGKDFGYGQATIPVSPGDRAFGKQLFASAEKLLGEGKLKTHPADVSEGGLEAVVSKGLEEIKSGKGSGVKLVYKL
jgi:hypothetical protein